MTNPQPCNDVVRVRLPAATHKALQSTGAPVSRVIRQAIDLYLAHPAMKASNPQQSNKVTT